MLVIDKDDIEKYRYAVGKVAFLTTYSQYKFIEDYENSNGMLVYNVEKAMQESIFLFSFPKRNITNIKHPITIAYQKYVRNSKKKSAHQKTFILSKEFDKKYNMDIIQALVAPARYYEQLEKNQKLFFENLLVDIYSAHDSSGKVYKYWTNEKIDNNRHFVNDGHISFSNPNIFNDPFDSNCLFADGSDLSSLFRVFCVAPDYKNILMWSYYANNHKGYCFEYSKADIINAIFENKIVDGLCIIGHVDYKKNRPKLLTGTSKLSYTEITSYIEAAFTKYDKWKHEEEYRFVVLSGEFRSSKSDFLELKVNINCAYNGCKGTGNPVIDSYEHVVKTIKMQKDSKEYELFC